MPNYEELEFFDEILENMRMMITVMRMYIREHSSEQFLTDSYDGSEELDKLFACKPKYGSEEGIGICVLESCSHMR